MIEVWGRADSSNVQMVMWAIGELGLEHRRHDFGHRFGGLDTAEFGAMTPHRLVPVIRDDGGPPIWESSAILRYLAARHGSDSFWPRDPLARAQVDMWAEWARGSVQRNFIVPIFWGLVRTPPLRRDPAALARAGAVLFDELRKAEAQLARHDCLAGPDLTPADMQLGHILYRYYDIALDRPRLPALRRYYDRLTERPAYRTHVMVSYEALRATD